MVGRVLEHYAVTIGRLEITEIKGLRSNTVGVFTQETDPHRDGRIFMDTTEDWNGGLLLPSQKDRQRIKLTVRVIPDDMPISNFRILWEVTDPDDPADSSDVDRNDGGDLAAR